MYSLKDFEIYDRPGYFGKKRVEKTLEYNYKYPDGWEECWYVRGNIYSFWEAVMLYEDAYFSYLKEMPKLVDWVTTFHECYDNDKRNIEDGVFYDIRQPVRHLQDVAVRRVLLRMGRYFEGKDPENLLEIRGEGTNGYVLMPGLVAFHIPNIILQPPDPCGNIPKWVRPGTVEEFWQRNKVIGKKKAIQNN